MAVISFKINIVVSVNSNNSSGALKKYADLCEQIVPNGQFSSIKWAELDYGWLINNLT